MPKKNWRPDGPPHSSSGFKFIPWAVRSDAEVDADLKKRKATRDEIKQVAVFLKRNPQFPHKSWGDVVEEMTRR
jgi:hypothetical protein